ncbi:MAG: hypothetical protein ACREOH_05675 [Candidatus Entotheonellia bacterium]
MLSYLVYKNMHLIGVFMILVSLGGFILQRIQGSTQAFSWRKAVAITHGVGMALALLGGFGMLARLGIHWPWPGWIIGKVGIWLVFGALLAVTSRTSIPATSLWWTTIVLAGLAAYLALHKPF